MSQMQRLMTLLLFAMLVLAGCGGSDDGGESAAPEEPTRARPTRTAKAAPTEEEEPPTATRRRAVRPTPTADDGDEDPVVPGELETITTEDGDVSVGCPNNWKVDVGDRSLQCLQPQEQVVIQINTNDLPSTLPSKELAERSNEELKKSFGENYIEDGMEEQSDGSYRIDFEVTASEEHGTPDLVGRAFVEEHNNIFYLFMILIQADKVEEHNDIVEEIIDSYAVDK